MTKPNVMSCPRTGAIAGQPHGPHVWTTPALFKRTCPGWGSSEVREAGRMTPTGTSPRFPLYCKGIHDTTVIGATIARAIRESA